jgi:demethylmenaquinone methyltransferase/2-methoxy-6-polyprenyl-1,4-benzoquinol methylase
VLSFGQDPRWRRFLVSTVDVGPLDTVLDVATGTAAVALELARQKDCYVVGVDLTPEMLEEGRRRVVLAAATGKIRLEEADARALPFDDGTFDAVTFTYLLRYVEDPAATLRELVRVVKAGGTVSGLEFGLPRGPWRPLWEAWTRVGLPAAGRLIGDGWYEVGTFLNPSITGFYARWPMSEQLAAWSDAGLDGVRSRRLSLGGGVVTWGRKRK